MGECFLLTLFKEAEMWQGKKNDPKLQGTGIWCPMVLIPLVGGPPKILGELLIQDLGGTLPGLLPVALLVRDDPDFPPPTPLFD